MTPLVLSLALTAPAHPPAPVVITPPVQVAPGVRLQPQIAQLPPVYRPPVVVVPVVVPVPVVRPVPIVPLVPPIITPVVPIQPVPQAVTLTDFSRFFAPTPGKHDVLFVHPVTGQAVKVCFVLPAGKLTEFKVEKRSIRFEFRGGAEVEIDFRSNGTVKVDYDD
jgi:hypothetical protein